MVKNRSAYCKKNQTTYVKRCYKQLLLFSHILLLLYSVLSSLFCSKLTLFQSACFTAEALCSSTSVRYISHSVRLLLWVSASSRARPPSCAHTTQAERRTHIWNWSMTTLNTSAGHRSLKKGLSGGFTLYSGYIFNRHFLFLWRAVQGHTYRWNRLLYFCYVGDFWSFRSGLQAELCCWVESWRRGRARRGKINVIYLSGGETIFT